MDTNSTQENDIPLVFGKMGSGKKSSLGKIGLRQRASETTGAVEQNVARIPRAEELEEV